MAALAGGSGQPLVTLSDGWVRIAMSRFRGLQLEKTLRTWSPRGVPRAVHVRVFIGGT